MSPKPSFRLSAAEQILLAQIDFELGTDDALSSLDAAGKLASSLLKRNAIPTIRLHYFTDPEFNIGGTRSREGVFEKNGTSGNAILKHPHFLPYLHYFIFGPRLPDATITMFGQRVKESGGFVSGSDWPDLDGIVRQAIRQHGLDASDAAEEFFKLALECGLDRFLARHFRDTAKKTRK